MLVKLRSDMFWPAMVMCVAVGRIDLDPAGLLDLADRVGAVLQAADLPVAGRVWYVVLATTSPVLFLTSMVQPSRPWPV